MEPFAPPPSPHANFLLLCTLFYLCGFANFVFRTLDNFHFQRQVGLSQIKIMVLISLKFRLHAVFFKWGSGMSFLFVGRQGIVNYWDFTSNSSRNSWKIWYGKLIEMITENYLWKCLFANNWLFLQILLEWLCLQSFSCRHYTAVFSELAFRSSLRLFSNFFLPLTTSAISCSATFNKSAATRFEAATKFLRKNGSGVPPKSCASARNPCPLCRPKTL